MSIPALTEKGCRKRRDSLLKNCETDLVVIADPRNLYYYGGFLPPYPSLSEWGPVYLIIDRKSAASTLVCHNFAAGAAENAHVDKKEIWTWYDASRTSGVDIYPAGTAILADFIRSSTGGHIGVETGWFPLIPAITTGVDYTDITATISRQRRRKDPDELACIRYAQDSSLAGHIAGRKKIRPGLSELELFSLINTAMTKKAGCPVKLIGDILSGPRTLDVSGGPTDRVIGENDTVILDLSPVVHGYRADYTATIVLDPEPDQKLLDLEKALHGAIAAGESQLRPGRTGRDIYWAVKNCLNDRGFGGQFEHHAGHGLGLGHPEAPFFVPESSEKLIVGDVVTLEPGSYAPGCAGRIEHVYLITENGPERLTRHDTRFTCQ